MINWILDIISEPSTFLVIAVGSFIGAGLGTYEKDRVREWAFGAFSIFCLAVAALLHKLS